MADLLNSDIPRSVSIGWRRQLRKAINIGGIGLGRSGSSIPKYDHDRCERSLQMRIYALSKGQFALLFAVFSLIFVVLMMIGMAGPPMTSVRQRRAKDLPLANSTDLTVGPIVVSSPILSTYCHQLWVIARFYTAESRQGSLHEIYETSFRVGTETLASTSYTEGTELLGKDRQRGVVRNQLATLHCKDNVCDQIIMAHLAFIEYHQYHFIFRFDGLREFSARFPIENIIFYFKSYNPSFMRLSICFRFAFACIGLLATVWFHRNLSSYPVPFWSIEQKWMAVLLPLLFLFNDPLYPLIFLVNSSLPSVIDSIFQITFLSYLLLSWLCIYHGLKQTNRSWLTFYLPKIIIVASLWFGLVVLSVMHHLAAFRDSGSGHSSWEGSQGFKIFFYVTGSMYMTYLIILMIRSYKELRHLPYFDIRLKFFTPFVWLILGVTFAMIVSHFGITSAVEDNFASSLSTSYKSSAQFTIFYGLINCYLLISAFAYSPNPNVVPELQMSEQPPTASALLMNDSEDELFGPEITGRNVRTHFGEDESDGD